MKYILNKGRYALTFKIIKNNLDFKIDFDKRRFYQDTGNIATSGITEVSDEDLVALKKNKEFARLFDEDIFEEVDGYRTSTVPEEALKAKDAEIAKLKKQLQEGETKGDKKEDKKKLEEKDIEIKSLKAQLEALKSKKEKSAQEDVEGF